MKHYYIIPVTSFNGNYQADTNTDGLDWYASPAEALESTMLGVAVRVDGREVATPFEDISGEIHCNKAFHSVYAYIDSDNRINYFAILEQSSQAKTKRLRRAYDREHYDKMQFRIRKELAEKFRATATANGDSMANIVAQAISEYIQKH